MRVALPMFLVLAALTFITEGCKRSDSATVTGGGPGGHAVLPVIPEHHGGFVLDCTVYIKYGTTIAPPDGVYDDSIQCSTTSSPDHTTPMAVFRNLKAGQYYLYGTGLHPGYNPPNVKGGLPYIIHQEIPQQNFYLHVYSYQP